MSTFNSGQAVALVRQEGADSDPPSTHTTAGGLSWCEQLLRRQRWKQVELARADCRWEDAAQPTALAASSSAAPPCTKTFLAVGGAMGSPRLAAPTHFCIRMICNWPMYFAMGAPGFGKYDSTRLKSAVLFGAFPGCPTSGGAAPHDARKGRLSMSYTLEFWTNPYNTILVAPTWLPP